MVKKELLQMLEKFDDDQYVFIQLHNKDELRGETCRSMVVIQAVAEAEPWHNSGKKNLIALVGHAQNAGVKPFLTNFDKFELAESCK